MLMSQPSFLHDNEVDGEAFVLLDDKQIKTLVAALGPQMKLGASSDKV